jgi:hypothetical protein
MGTGGSVQFDLIALMMQMVLVSETLDLAHPLTLMSA